MLKNKFTLALGLLVAGQVVAAPTVYPTGVTIHDPEKTHNQYIVFTASDEKSYLVDINGQVVNSWNYRGFPIEVIDPKVNKGKKGHVFVQHETRKNNAKRALGNGVNNHSVAELDWNGQVIWKWAGEKEVGNAHQHHEITRLANANTLILANKLHKIKGFKVDESIDDAIYEVDAKGHVVWRWLASEHLEEFGFTPEQLELIRNDDHEDYLHFNNAVPLGINKWYDTGDQRFHPDNIIVDSRNGNFLAIIDKKTGKIVYRIGPNYDSKPDGSNPFLGGEKLPRPVDQLSGLHDAKLIAKGLPGEGNILVFDNHSDAGYPAVALKAVGRSRVVEIDPITQQIVWEYAPGASFYSSRTSLARRLPNGNTLITEGQFGRVFQVTPKGEIVWEYVTPFFSKATPERPTPTNFLYRATPVPLDWVPANAPKGIAVVPPTLTDFKVPNQAK